MYFLPILVPYCTTKSIIVEQIVDMQSSVKSKLNKLANRSAEKNYDLLKFLLMLPINGKNEIR